MALTSNGRAGPMGREGLANVSLNNNNNYGPPPSTLAAQLVENISASTRSSRPDETAELKRFFGTIEEVKNQPDLLKTPKQRMDHNHMLIYVYTRVVLEGLKWDDPFADKGQLRAEASRAVNFLKIAIRETPEVLIESDSSSFLFRGSEPLWLWIFPKIVKMLGNSYCADLRDEINSFFREIFLTASTTGLLWLALPRFLEYIMSSFNAIINHFRELAASDKRDVSFRLQLPPDSFFTSIACGDLKLFQQQCTHAVPSASQALQHASGLLSIMAIPLTHQRPEFDTISTFQENIPWLLDAYLSFHKTQTRWQHISPSVLPDLLRDLVQLIKVHETTDGADISIQRKMYTTFILLCVEMSTQFVPELMVDGQENPNYQLFCISLVKVSTLSMEFEPILRLVKSLLIPVLEKLTWVEDDATSETDLWRSVELVRKVVAESMSVEPKVRMRADKFSDEIVRQQVNKLDIDPTPSDIMERYDRERKRRRVSKVYPIEIILDHIYERFPIENPDFVFVSVVKFMEEKYQQLSEADLCRLIELLGYTYCAADDNTISIHEGKDKVYGFDCRICRVPHSSLEPPRAFDDGIKKSVVKIFTSLVKSPGFLEAQKPRVTAMVAVRRIAKHCRDPSLLDIEVSVIAQWCLKSLQSSVRELRIAAGRTIAAFLCASNRPQFSKVMQKNCGNILNILRSLSEQSTPQLTETCIMAWSQVGSVIPEGQLNLVLIKLVEYLGSESMITSAAAFAEILRLARSRGMTTRQFFEPFWRYLAFSATKDLLSQPKLTRLLAELLDMTIAEFLVHIEKSALPWLVLTKKRGVIQKIAEARNEKEIWQPCLDEANLGPILALLLIQEVPDVQQHSMELLRHVSPHLNKSEGLLELLRIEPIGTTLELLITAGDAEEDRKPHIRNVLNKVASMMLAGSANVKQKKVHASGPFLQRYALAIMAGLTQVINDISNKTPTQIRERYIRAMEEMIRTGKYYIRIARPQISACLQGAIQYDELRSAAFSCWAAMFLHMGDVEALVETTFFLISNYWFSFDEATQQQARDLIESLLTSDDHILESTISKLPSFSHINSLSDLEARLSELRQPVDSRTAFSLLAERIRHENDGVVLLALRELSSYLQRQQGYLQASAVSEQPDSVVPTLARSLLDCASRFNGIHNEISDLCTRCLGLMGCLDPNRVETVRAEKQIVVRSNFEHSGETTDFVIHLLEEVLVKSFLSATDTKPQGFLSFAMQELLDRSDIKVAVEREGLREAGPVYRKWLSMSVTAREVLTPFLTSRYVVQPMAPQQIEYPLFRPGRTKYANWMRSFTLDLMRKPQTPFAGLIFDPLCRVIRIKDLSIAEFLFPYVVLHIVVGEDATEELRTNVLNELLNVLKHEVPVDATYEEKENQKLYCEAIFRFIDYAMRWLHLKRGQTNLNPRDILAMDKIQAVLGSIPSELISQRAVDCKAYARALFHLEQHIRHVDEFGVVPDPKAIYTEEENPRKQARLLRERLFQRLQDIYPQIDEPDGLEGISAHQRILDVNQQVLGHRKAGRWAAAQTWYEIKLAEDPDNAEIQIDLLTCLKESGQHDVLLNYVEGIEKHTANTTINRIVPFAVEASWATGRWQTMEKFIAKYQGDRTENFNVSIAQTLLYLRKGWTKEFIDEMRVLRDRVNVSMNLSVTSSLHACHESMLKCHVLTDLELIAGINNDGNQHPQEILKTLDRRLEVLGSYVNDKQYVLSIRRAAMELKRPRFGNMDISALWLSSARLARKSNLMHQSFNAVLHASQLGDHSATIENARLLWKEGHNRKAIQALQGAIDTGKFTHRSFVEQDSSEKNLESQQNLLAARAQLLLAKWLDSAGQTHASALREHYRNVPKNYGTWEKGHYYLGRHYKKVLESERALKPDDQSDEYLTGETAKLVIENYIRSLNYGTKYLYQTLPRILTLWLELGAQVNKAPEGKMSISKELHYRRKTQLDSLHKYLSKSIQRLPAYIFYTNLPQIVARVAHPNTEVYLLLEDIILRVVEAHPRQALWSLFAIMTSQQRNPERRARGQQLLQKLRSRSTKAEKAEKGTYDMKTLLRMGEKLAEQLLMACNNGDFQSNRSTIASITRDLHFNHKCTPCPLVVPIEACLTATLPTLTDNVRKHKAFSRDVIQVQAFLDEVLVLGSLAKPRKLTARGSNGVNYGLLIKPKDDLRTDQRLMEFNSMINRSLKRDAESSKRQLYIKTYAVTPLNEECGIIEWVDGLKTLRDILLNIYRSRGIVPNYQQLQSMMKDAALGGNNISIFTAKILKMFPPVLPNWFISQFPNPSTWFTARLRYTRSCAVMSMVGTILGLGDRHGENVLLEEGNGGVFHVDFNCLFDKGLTFAQPERVPFRLTHNMVAAMGIYGYEGPFRKCSELTLSILRQQEETLMTILEAFIYDPTLDLQRDKRRKNEAVKLNPQSVVDSIKRKVRGLLPDESIPLGVEGQVEELIKQAVDPKNLTSMYIGWCPFL
ncbi:phosphatidyl inositol 3-kinase [Hypoxylon trugodes]|uniref:phosphatidyl inositol 3-kinase n=1 Tax=Hypoxylon trugodes TaxID=326681 RepID=UPI002198AF3F|nr:phosphatidyl inositol 3-kinase [Hypoxylon trugodes]KAI1392547.1 phosphatidyl inositol 3-kinase [Hypoxylon trugodes]